MSLPTMFVSFVYFAILLGVYGLPMQHAMHGTAGGHEEYEIKLHINGGNTTWKIINWQSNKTKDDVVKAILEYGKGRKLGLPTIPGYRGYVINHKGAMSHEWVLPKCEKPNLEIAILEYTASSAVVNQYLAEIKTSLQSCPTKKKTV